LCTREFDRVRCPGEILIADNLNKTFINMSNSAYFNDSDFIYSNIPYGTDYIMWFYFVYIKKKRIVNIDYPGVKVYPNHMNNSQIKTIRNKIGLQVSIITRFGFARWFYYKGLEVVYPISCFLKKGLSNEC